VLDNHPAARRTWSRSLPCEYLQVDSRWIWVIFTDNMRQETLFRGLVACFNALGFVPWVLVPDNMKTVTTGRDDQQQPIGIRTGLASVSSALRL
jgi:transposase